MNDMVNVIVVTSKLRVFSINGGAVTKPCPGGDWGQCVWIIWPTIRFTGKGILQKSSSSFCSGPGARHDPWEDVLDMIPGRMSFVGP